MNSFSKKVLASMEEDFLAIQQARTPYMLKDLVVNTKFTPEQRWAQMVLEMSIAYDNLRTAKCDVRLKEIEIKEMPKKTEKEKLEREKKVIELDQLNRARLGALREFEFLFGRWKDSKRHYTREELNNASPEEYRMRLETQAQHDILSSGRVSVGNLEGLRQAGLIDKYAGMMNMQQPALVEGMDEIEQRFLEEGKLKCTIIIPSAKPAVNGTPLTEDVLLPTNVEFKVRNIHSAPVAENYNAGFEMAIREGCTHILTLEDDQVLEEDSIVRLFDFALKNPNACVGAWYPKKERIIKGAHIEVKGAHRQFMECDYQVHEAKTLAMGLTIYPISILKQIDFPRCKTTDHLSQDSYLSQKIRDKGFKLLVDTSIQIGHKDRVTGEVFGEVKKPEPKAMQVKEELAEMLEFVKGKKLICEIGTARGGALYKMMQVADKEAEFVSIDMPNGPYGGEFGQPDIKTMCTWLQKGQKLTTIRCDSKQKKAINEVKKVLKGRKFDFILIDGDHTYKGVKNDYLKYKEFCDGPICFHDIAHHSNPDIGVEKFWNEIKKGKKFTEIIWDKKQGRAGIGVLHPKK